MHTIESSRSAGSPLFGRATTLWVAVATLFVLTGCDGSKTDPEPPAAVASGNLDKRCDDLLDFAIDMLRPDRLGISSHRDDAINNLNNWQSNCGEIASTGDEPVADDQAILEQYLTPEVIERVVRDHYSARDGSHVRNCLLYDQMARIGQGTSQTDLERVVNVFHYVMRNVALTADDPDLLPLSPYEVAMLGRGTAEDRAWLFVNLLRQMQTDAVILRPRSEGADAQKTDADSAWLVGVLLKDGIFLFDTRLGSPIPTSPKTPDAALVMRPATLSEALSDPSILEWVNRADKTQTPLRSEDFKNPKVQLVGNSGFWAGRLLRLQHLMSGENACILYDGLADDEQGPGAVSRVATAGGDHWSKADISVWTYPEDRIHAAENRTDDQQKRFDKVWLAFQEPQEYQFGYNQSTGQLDLEHVKLKPADWSQLKTRTKQLLGDYSTAVQSYLSIRLRKFYETLPIPERIQIMHGAAKDDAFFWGAVCKYEQQEYESSANALADYITTYADTYPQGKWLSQARLLRALCLAQTDQRDEAIRVLKEIPQKDPLWQGAQLLIRRWQAMAGKK